MSGKAAAIILAAGLSSRMSGFKPLLPLGEKTVLAGAVDLFRLAGVGRVVVVAGHRAGEVWAEAHHARAETVLNEDFIRGMFSSVLAGVRALGPDGADGPKGPEMSDGVGGPDGSAWPDFFMLPVDVMLVRPWTVAALLKAREENPGTLLHPTFRGERGHPPLIPGSLCPGIMGWSGERGLGGFLDQCGCPSLDVPVPDESVILDVDTDQDYEMALKRLARRHAPNPEECEAILTSRDNFRPPGLAHARAVARHALAMAHALGNGGGRGDGQDRRLDLDLIHAAALLHDLAKGLPDHEHEGGRILSGMGLTRVADIVAAHRDLRLGPDGAVTEREIVYLADKVARGAELVRVEERFQSKMDMFAEDPEALAAIRGRLDNALAVKARVEELTGRTLESVLASGGD